MNFNYLKGLFEKEEDSREGLKSFIDNLYWGEDLTEEEAKKNLERGVIELFYPNGQHKANGIMVTENGYFLTAAHCVNGDFAKSRIGTGEGLVCSIEKICATDKKNDIALVKAKMSGEEKPIIYKYYNDKVFSDYKKTPVVILTRRERKLLIKGGHTNGKTLDRIICANGNELLNQMLLEINAIPGDSGGVLSTIKGEIVGIATARHKEALITSCAIWREALNLISYYYQTRN